MQVRHAVPADLPSTYEVFTTAIRELFDRHRFSPPDPVRSAYIAQQAHLLEHDAERFWVAEEKAQLIGFAAALERDSTWFLSSLFILPKHQRRGIGKELFRRAWGAGSPHLRLTIADAIQPVALGLYSRAGLMPSVPVVNVAGRAEIEEEGELEPSEPEPGAVAALDRAAYGFDRAVDHAHWEEGASPTLWRREGEPVAYAYCSPGGRIGPLAGTSPEDAAVALRAELARRSGERVSLIIPGSSVAILQVALEAGLRYTDPPALLLASGPVAPSALALSGYSLY